MINLNKIQDYNWTKAKISILGAGKSGIAVMNLCKYIGAKPFISEATNNTKLYKFFKDIDFEINGHTNKVLDGELLILSPGINPDIPIVKKAKQHQIPIVSEIEFASWFTSTPIIAVTGSNGKSTTVNLIKKMFDCAKIKTQLGGNFGTPFSDLVLLEKKNPGINTLNILEISSFQLENIYHFSPNYSIILNISPDHLDRHGNLQNYLKQKLKIAKNLREPGWLIFNSGDILLSNQLHDYERNIPFSQSYSDQALLSLNNDAIYYKETNKILIDISEMGLEGIHNIDNALAASTLAIKYGLKHQHINQALKEIEPLNHRMELVTEVDGIKFYNDSKATNIESTIAAIRSFKKNIILILGGRDKGETNYEKLLEFELGKIKSIVTYGEAGKKIKQQLEIKYLIKYCEKFNEATKISINNSIKGDIVLLSPSCSSFDQFKNYEDRGNYFKKIIFEKYHLC